LRGIQLSGSANRVPSLPPDQTVPSAISKLQCVIELSMWIMPWPAVGAPPTVRLLS